MIFHETSLRDAVLIEPEPHADERGFFARVFDSDEFESRGMVADYVQHNVSLSRRRGTVRGLHYQRGENVEAKLVRCTRGALVDVIVDLRGGSPTYLKHEAFELSAENRRLLYVPPGFAHGFQSLVDDVEVFYPASAAYAPAAEGGVGYDDPAIGIAWPLPVADVSDKDASWPRVAPGDVPVFDFAELSALRSETRG